MCLVYACYQMQVWVPDIQWGQTNWNRVWNREKFIAGPSKEQVDRAQKTQTHGLFGEVFIGKIWDEGFRMWGFLLIDWWCSNRVVLQGSCAQWKITSSTWVGALVQRHGFACSSRRNQNPALTLGYCLKTAPPLFLHSLPFLISNCLILPLGT